MLVSAQANLAFAHFPKTAGTSLTAMLTAALPDARLIDPADKHLAVRESYRRLCRRKNPVRAWMRRLKGLPCGTCEVEVPDPKALRVIGVVREPFDMAVSLFEYWRKYLAHRSDRDATPLISAATRGDFIGFLELLGEDASQFPTYHQFYDVEGPLWPNTILIDFAHLKEGLAEAFAQLDIKVDLDQLGQLNTNARTEAQMLERRAQAGGLADKVRRRYERGRPLKLLGRDRRG